MSKHAQPVKQKSIFSRLINSLKLSTSVDYKITGDGEKSRKSKKTNHKTSDASKQSNEKTSDYGRKTNQQTSDICDSTSKYLIKDGYGHLFNTIKYLDDSDRRIKTYSKSSRSTSSRNSISSSKTINSGSFKSYNITNNIIDDSDSVKRRKTIKSKEREIFYLKVTPDKFDKNILIALNSDTQLISTRKNSNQSKISSNSISKETKSKRNHSRNCSKLSHRRSGSSQKDNHSINIKSVKDNNTINEYFQIKVTPREIASDCNNYYISPANNKNNYACKIQATENFFPFTENRHNHDTDENNTIRRTKSSLKNGILRQTSDKEDLESNNLEYENSESFEIVSSDASIPASHDYVTPTSIKRSASKNNEWVSYIKTPALTNSLKCDVNKTMSSRNKEDHKHSTVSKKEIIEMNKIENKHSKHSELYLQSKQENKISNKLSLLKTSSFLVSPHQTNDTTETKCSIDLPTDESHAKRNHSLVNPLDLNLKECQKQLFTARLTAAEASEENRRLHKEMSNLRKHYDDLLPRYTHLKKKVYSLQLLEVELKSLSLTNNKLNRKVEQLQETIKTLETKDLDNQARTILIEQERDKLKQNCIEMKMELEHLSAQIRSSSREAIRISELKAQEQAKDLKIRLMHNELIELKGNIRVIARFKPSEAPNKLYQFKLNETVGVCTRSSLDSSNTNDVVNSTIRSFTFNKIFTPSATQEEVYGEVASYVTSCLDGYNVCVMTYGQTGSGKTYTMKGTESNPGIIARTATQLFSEAKQRTLWEFHLYMSIIQIYNESMSDLLSDKMRRVHIHDDGYTVYIKGLQEFQVTSHKNIEDFIEKGKKRCATARTTCNNDSSRSHFIVMLRVYGISTIKNQESNSIITLCDLAGLEKCNMSNPILATETKFISKSLAVLGRVFEALRNKSKSVPFRESKLTHLLKASLSGDAKCVLILTISTTRECLENSLRTLDFGIKAMSTSLGVPVANSSDLKPLLRPNKNCKPHKTSLESTLVSETAHIY